MLVVAQESPPGTGTALRRRREMMPFHDVFHRLGIEGKAEFEQLAVDAVKASVEVLTGQTDNPILEFWLE
jgi:hypothetical protein